MPDRFAELLIRKRRLFIAVLFLLTLVFAWGIRDLGVNFSFDSFFPRDEEYEFFTRYQEIFPNDDNIIYVALKSENQAGLHLDFVSSAGRLFDSLRTIPDVDSVITLAGIPWLTRKIDGIRAEPYLQSGNQEEFLRSMERICADSLLLSSFILPEKGLYCGVILINEEILDLPQRDVVCEAVRNAVQNSGMKNVISGIPVIRSGYVKRITDELIYFVSVSTFLIVLMLIWAYRSWWGLLIPMVGIAATLIWCVGLMGWTGKDVDLMFELLPPILFVVSTSDIIHLVSRYSAELRVEPSREKAMKTTLKEIGAATFLTSFTTAIGFASMAFTGMKPIRDFGIYSALGVLFAWIIAIVLVPHGLLLINPDKIRKSKGFSFSGNWEKTLETCYQLGIRRQKMIFAISTLIVVVSCFGIYMLTFNAYLLEDVSRKDPIRADMKFFEENFQGVRPFEMAIIPADGKKTGDPGILRQIHKLDSFIATTRIVSPTISPASMAMTANWIYNFRSPRQMKLPSTHEKTSEIFGFIRSEGGGSFLGTVMTADESMGRISGRMGDIGTENFEQFKNSIRNFYNSECDTSLFHYRLTGSARLAERNIINLQEGMFSGLLIAFLLIAIPMGMLFRSTRILFISLIPNLIPILFIAGVMGFSGISMRASTSITFGIAFGIVVDDTIHFLSRYRVERELGRDLETAIRNTLLGTGRSMILTTIFLVSGFCLLLTSDFGGTFIVGLFVTLALFGGMLSDVFLLPALLRAIRHEASGNKSA